MNKWKSLKREYKAVIDQNAKTGNNNIKKCKFYEKCKNLYGNKPSTRSDFTMDSSTGGKSNTESSFDASTNNGTSNSDKRKLGEFQDLSPDTDDDNELPDISKKATKRKVPGRKVKQNQSNHSGVDKIIDFMEKVQEKEEAKQERHEEFIRKQNKEKLERFDRLLDILSKT